MSSDSLKDYYARRAGEYERIYAKPERQSDLRTLEAKVTELLADRRVLEIACGTGYWTQFAAQSAHAITATDINPEVLEIARSKSYRIVPHFLIADAWEMDKIEGEFDALLAAFWWSHIPRERLEKFLANTCKSLPANALIVTLDNRFVAGSSTPIVFTDERGNSYQDRILTDGSRHRVLKNFPTGAELRATIAGVASTLKVIELEYYWLAAWQVDTANNTP